MTLRVEPLTDEREPEYEEVLKSVPESMLYASLQYRDFLLRVVPNSEARYFVAWDDGRPVGVLPAILGKAEDGRRVLNSLPFFGSNGGVLVAPHTGDVDAVRRALLQRFEELAKEARVVASTLVSSPLDGEADAFYAESATYAFVEERIGQITPLPTKWADPEQLVQVLMDMYHQKTRNAIRKAEGSGVQVAHSGSPEVLRELVALHTENMTAIGGTPKPSSVFEAISASFRYDQDYRVYTARYNGRIIAALLVFFYNRTAEYFTPATQAEHRPLQPMSLLIREAMSEAALRRFLYWNWGGTWKSQGGVYQFKSRWGTIDRPYRYYTRLFDPGLLSSSSDQLISSFPYQYVVPFSELRNATR